MPMIPAWGVSLLIAGGGMGLQMLFAPRPPKQQPVDVGKFDDVRIQGSDYGAFIPRGWGKFRAAGNIVFTNGIQHYVIDEPTGGGKGVPQAPATRRHIYQSSFAILIARGPIISYGRVWEDADVWIGGIFPNTTEATFEAEDATLSGGASIATVGGVTFVQNLGNGGEALFDFTTVSPPADPYDPEENAVPKTWLEFYYKDFIGGGLDVVVTTNDGTGPVSQTISFITSGGEWTGQGIVLNGFIESLEWAHPTQTTPLLDYIYLSYFWDLPTTISLPIPYHNFRVSGVINPDIAYPPDINTPTPYYNADIEDLKDAQGTYNLESSIPGDVYRWYTGTETQAADPIIQDWLDGRYGAGQGVLRASAMRGLVYVMFGNKTLKQARPANYTFELDTGPDDVNDILADLCNDVGITSGDRDFSATTGLTQIGFLESSNTSRASLFDQLQRYHLFRRAEIDGKVKTVLHSFSPVYTVPLNSLRAHDGDSEMPAYDAEVVVAEEHLLPREMRFSVMNPQRDYHNETATAQLFTVPGRESEEFSFNIVDELDTARLQVEKALLKTHSESQAIEIMAMPELAQYSVGDVITVPVNGVNVNIRIEKKQMTLPIGAIRIQGVTVTPFTPTFYQAETTTTVSLAREQVATFNYPRNSIIVAIQSMPIREADQGKLGIYLAPCGRGYGAGENIAVHREFGDENFIIQFVADTPAQVGLCEDTLATHGDVTTKDTTNVLDIWFFDVIELESVPTADLDRHLNLNLMRVGDEWVQFETATAQTLEDNSPYRSKWRISNLWRGRFGTEAAVSTHGADEYAVHATHALKFYELEKEDVGKSITLKAVTGGQAVELAPQTTFTFDPLFDGSQLHSIFDHLTNATTSGTGQETLHTGTVPAYTFFEDGDEVRIVYRGFFGNNANQKEFLLDMDLANYFDTGALTKNGGVWKIEVDITRIASDTLSLFAKYEDALTTITDLSTSGGLDLTVDIDFLFRVITPDLAGDITLSTAKAVFYPAAPVVEVITPEGVEFLGDGLEFGGVAVEFTA